MKSAFFAAVLIVTLATCTGQGQALPNISDSLHRSFDFKSFVNYSPAQQRIDMDSIDYQLLNAAIFFETNHQRALNGLPLLKHSPALEKAAVMHSTDMVEHSYFSHTSSRSGQETFEARLSHVGIGRVNAAENIAIVFGVEYEAGKPVYTPEQNGGYFSYEFKGGPIPNCTYLGFARQVLKQFMDSEHHRENILNPDFHYFGAGAVHFRDSDFHNMDEFKVTQLFAKSLGEDR